MAVCSITLKVKVARWVRPLIAAAAILHRSTGWPHPRAAERLARFIARHGVKVSC